MTAASTPQPGARPDAPPEESFGADVVGAAIRAAPAATCVATPETWVTVPEPRVPPAAAGGADR